MNEHEPVENDDLLSRQLRREARYARLKFSTALHARIMAAVRAAPSPDLATAVRKSRTLRGHLMSWTAAAATSLALAATLALLWHTPGPARPAVVENPGGDRSADGGSLPATPPATSPESGPASGASGDLDAAADEVATAASGLTDWMQSTAGDSQWAGLDRDAQAALATVAGPLPFDLTLSIAVSRPSGP